MESVTATAPESAVGQRCVQSASARCSARNRWASRRCFWSR